MKRFASCFLLVFSAATGCGDDGSGQMANGGSGGNQLMQQSSYTASCTIKTVDPEPVVLEFPIELSYLLSRPYAVSTSSDLSFSASVIVAEVTSAALIDAGISEIDVNSMEITTWLRDATPSTLDTSLTNLVNDLDLQLDTDDNGMAGPHRIELDTVTTATAAIEGATEVELGLGRDGVSLQLGDFNLPNNCLSLTLDGFTARFPVEPSR